MSPVSRPNLRRLPSAALYTSPSGRMKSRSPKEAKRLSVSVTFPRRVQAPAPEDTNSPVPCASTTFPRWSVSPCAAPVVGAARYCRRALPVVSAG